MFLIFSHSTFFNSILDDSQTAHLQATQADIQTQGCKRAVFCQRLDENPDIYQLNLAVKK
jgi:hypothetical protein